MTTRASLPRLGSETVAELRPSYEGSNIGTWIGFKHINYLAEEAVLQHFRVAGLSARSLYEDFGLCLELVDLDTRILSGFHLDEEVKAVVQPNAAESSGELAFKVSLSVRRGRKPVKAARSLVRVLLRRDTSLGAAEPPPSELIPFTISRIQRSGRDPAPIPSLSGPYSIGRGTTGGDPVLAELTRQVNAFAWRWRIPYPYCHFTERMQMSGYLRQMEEVVDLFLADHGISIKRLLDERRWIPVVPHSSIAMLDEAIMEEELYTVFTVQNIFMNFTFRARMDTYVMRDGELLRTAAGQITHGYAEISDRRNFSLVELDDRMLAALGG
jgi:acyl-CoA thioesterase FadM